MNRNLLLAISQNDLFSKEIFILIENLLIFYKLLIKFKCFFRDVKFFENPPNEERQLEDPKIIVTHL